MLAFSEPKEKTLVAARVPSSSELIITRKDLGLSICVPILYAKGMTWEFSRKLCEKKWREAFENCGTQPDHISWYGEDKVEPCDCGKFVENRETGRMYVDATNRVSFTLRGPCGTCVTSFYVEIQDEFCVKVKFPLQTPITDQLGRTQTEVHCFFEKGMYDYRNFREVLRERRITKVHDNDGDVKTRGEAVDHEIAFHDVPFSISMSVVVAYVMWNVGISLMPNVQKPPYQICKGGLSCIQCTSQRKEHNTFSTTDGRYSGCPDDFFYWNTFQNIFEGNDHDSYYQGGNPFEGCEVEVYELIPFMLKAAGLHLKFNFIYETPLLPPDPFRLVIDAHLGENRPDIFNPKTRRGPGPGGVTVIYRDAYEFVVNKCYGAHKAALTFVLCCLAKGSVLNCFSKDIRTLIGKTIWNTRFDDIWLFANGIKSQTKKLKK